MAHRCMATKHIHGHAFVCTKDEYHGGTCTFRLDRGTAEYASVRCPNCGRPGHATPNCPEKIGGTE